MFLYQTLDPSRGCTEEQARFCDSHGKMDKLAPVMASSQYVVAMLAAGSLPCDHAVLAAPFSCVATWSEGFFLSVNSQPVQFHEPSRIAICSAALVCV